ncbi:MAG: hypothetical protein JW869_00105 [Candidatus Omnitrophica bacterium]|nr:hypothetical protein [Candidatus Omnitrophota bacterium]
MKKGKERRRPVKCPHCRREMVSMKQVQAIAERFYVWYICPRREGEGGCGYACLVQVSRKTKQPKKTVLVVRAGESTPKKSSKGKQR